MPGGPVVEVRSYCLGMLRLQDDEASQGEGWLATNLKVSSLPNALMEDTRP